MKLDIQKMVIPFRYAVYLKQKGIKQESLFYWVDTENGVQLTANKDIRELIIGKEVAHGNIPPNSYSAFLTDELYHILEDDKPFNRNAIDFRFKYKDASIERKYIAVYCIGSVLIRTFMRYENQNKKLSDKEPKTPPKPHNPNPHENFR